MAGANAGSLAVVYEAVVSARQPYSAYNWLRSGASAAILAKLACGEIPLTHEALDVHPESRAADFLRHILVAHGLLPVRDDAIARLEAWLGARLDEIDSPEKARMLRSYANWRVLRRARQRAEPAHRPHTPTANAKTNFKAAVSFLAFLGERDVELDSCTQTEIDAWMSGGTASAHCVADFVDWAVERKLMADVVVASRPTSTGPALDSETRWAVVKRLLHDEELDLGDRVAGCLVALYGQHITHIVAMRREQISVHDGSTRMRIGVTHIEVPEPLAGLLTQLCQSRRSKTGVLSVPTPWLFPGLDPGRPLSASYLGARLRRLGVPVMATRRSALTHLGSRLPAAVIADLLGMHETTAVHWVQAARGDWNAYAAELVREGARDR